MSDLFDEPGAVRAPDAPPPSAADRAADAARAASDELLLLGARLHDEVALSVLYDRYGVLVYTLAHRILGDRQRAESVLQDVFLRCWHGQLRYDAGRGSPAVWLLGIARERALELLRHPQEQTAGPVSVQQHGPIGVEAAAPARGEEVVLRAMVGQALTVLTWTERQAIGMAYFGGLTRSQVAERLGQPPAIVRSTIRDGLRRLRRALAPVVDVGTPDVVSAS